MNRFLLLILPVVLMACNARVDDRTYNSGIHIIPQPTQVETSEGSFTIDRSTTIVIDGKIWEKEAGVLADKLSAASGMVLPLYDRERENAIILRTDRNIESEGYTIDVDKKHIILSASTETGMFYAIQSLLQLLPAEIEGVVPADIVLSVPAVRISDSPRFSYRGLMIDVCRHFFSIEELKRQISVMAMLKLNYLHLHLTDNQGWRIAIDRYPELVEHSAVQETYNGEKYGPFYYTKDDIRELISFADSHHVEVIPEIEFPGHSLAALVAFPELSCTGGPFESEQVFGYEENVFCVGNDSVFSFMENVLQEIADLFPSQYLHIGGDECVKKYWTTCPRCQALATKLNLKPDGGHSVEEQLQSYAIKRMERYISGSLGKRMLGWEEILEGGLPDGAAVMSWKGTESGAEAAALHHDIVMASMADGLYLCAAQGADEVEPAAMGGQSLLKDVYEFEPVPECLDKEDRSFVIGTQACLWSEWTPTAELLEYMLYPRAVALAETAWSQPGNKDWSDFLRRLENIQVRLDLKGINYHIPIPEGELTTNRVFTGDSVTLEFTNSRDLPMIYTDDNSTPEKGSPLLPEQLIIHNPCTLKICTKTAGGKLSPVRTVVVEKQQPMPAMHGEYPDKIRLSLATELFKNENDYSQAVFDTDTVIDSFASYDNSKFDFKSPSLAIYCGVVNVPQTGVYTFKSNADELWIADRRLIYNPTSSRFYRQKSQIALEKGPHPFRLVFSNRLKEGFASCWYPIDFQYQLPSGGEWLKP